MYNGVDLIKLYRLFDLNSIIQIDYNVNFRQNGYLLNISDQEHKYLDYELFKRKQKVIVEMPVKAKISNFIFQVNNLHQWSEPKFIEDNLFLNENYNFSVKVLDLNGGSSHNFLSVLNNQKIKIWYSFIKQADYIIPSLVINRDEDVKKDILPEFNDPIDNIFPDNLKDDIIPQDNLKEDIMHESPQGDDKLRNNRKKGLKKITKKIDNFVKKKEHLYKLQKVKELVKKLDTINQKTHVNNKINVKKLEQKKEIVEGHNYGYNLQLLRNKKYFQKLNFKQQKVAQNSSEVTSLIIYQAERKILDVKVASNSVNNLAEKFEKKYPIVLYQNTEKESEEVCYAIANEYCVLEDIKHEVVLISKILDSDFTKKLLQQKDLNIKINYPVVLYNKSNDAAGDLDQCLIIDEDYLYYTTALIPYEYISGENSICLAISNFSLAETLGMKLKEYMVCKPEDEPDDKGKKTPSYFDNFSNTDCGKNNDYYGDSDSNDPDLPGGGGWWPWFGIPASINKSENLEFNPIKKQIYTMFIANLGINTVRLPFFQNLINDLSKHIYSLEEAMTLLPSMSFDTLVEYYYAVKPQNTFNSLLNLFNYDYFGHFKQAEELAAEENEFTTPRKDDEKDNIKIPDAPIKGGYGDDVSTNDSLSDSCRSSLYVIKFIKNSERENEGELENLANSINEDDFNPNSNKSSFIEYDENMEEVHIDYQNINTEELQKKKDELDDKIKKLNKLKAILAKKNSGDKNINSVSIVNDRNQSTFRSNLEEQITIHKLEIEYIESQREEKIELLSKVDSELVDLDYNQELLIKRIFKLLKSSNKDIWSKIEDKPYMQELANSIKKFLQKKGEGLEEILESVRLKKENAEQNIKLEKNYEKYNKLKQDLEYAINLYKGENQNLQTSNNELKVLSYRIDEKEGQNVDVTKEIIKILDDTQKKKEEIKEDILHSERVIEKNNASLNVTYNVDELLNQYENIIKKTKETLKQKEELEEGLKKIDDKLKQLYEDIIEAEKNLSKESKKLVESKQGVDLDYSDTLNKIEMQLESLKEQVKLLDEKIKKGTEARYDLISINGEEDVDGHTSVQVTISGSSDKKLGLKLDLSAINKNNNTHELNNYDDNDQLKSITCNLNDNYYNNCDINL